MGKSEKGNAMSRISQSYVTGLEKYINELLNQVSSLKAELREICAAIDDPASDLTLTAVECIKKLKEDNESLKRDAERYRWLKSQEPSKHDGYAIGYFDACGVDAWRMTTKDLDQAIDAAISKGERG